MPYKTPQAIAVAAGTTGATKAALSPPKALVSGFLAGAYIAFGGLVAIMVSSGLDPKTWGTLPTLFTGAVFALGLILVVIAGADLLTGNMALVPMAVMRRQTSAGALARNLTCGADRQPDRLAVRGLLPGRQDRRADRRAAARPADRDRHRQGATETDWQIFLRAIGCNWLVCLAVWMALGAEDIAGKVLAIFFPIMAFVAIGFDHVVANMFFLPAAIFAHVDGHHLGRHAQELGVRVPGELRRRRASSWPASTSTSTGASRPSSRGDAGHHRARREYLTSS